MFIVNETNIKPASYCQSIYKHVETNVHTNIRMPYMTAPTVLF